jgi:hypothetical protein
LGGGVGVVVVVEVPPGVGLGVLGTGGFGLYRPAGQQVNTAGEPGNELVGHTTCAACQRHSTAAACLCIQTHPDCMPPPRVAPGQQNSPTASSLSTFFTQNSPQSVTAAGLATFASAPVGAAAPAPAAAAEPLAPDGIGPVVGAGLGLGLDPIAVGPVPTGSGPGPSGLLADVDPPGGPEVTPADTFPAVALAPAVAFPDVEVLTLMPPGPAVAEAVAEAPPGAGEGLAPGAGEVVAAPPPGAGEAVAGGLSMGGSSSGMYSSSADACAGETAVEAQRSVKSVSCRFLAKCAGNMCWRQERHTVQTLLSSPRL